MQTIAESAVLGDLLYEYTVGITAMTEYGVSLGDLMSGAAPIPPGGARFDVWFEGPVESAKLSGVAKGVDYLYVRADGQMDLHIHATIEASNGDRISLDADGTCMATPGNPVAELRENVRLFSSHATYAWVNPLQIWGIGTVDLAAGKVHIKGFAA